jgi:hypothetical protein
MKTLECLMRHPHKSAHVVCYLLTDRLHDGRKAQVRADQLPRTLAAWLAELGAHSPLVDELAKAVCAGDWPTAHAVADQLCVDVAVAA